MELNNARLNKKKGFTPLEITRSKSKHKKSKSLRGFTLIELLIVITIAVLLSVMILTSYQSGRNEFALQRAAHKLAQDIRRASEMAMSAKKFGGSIPPGGYGIHLSSSWSTYYKLYADMNGNEKYGAGDSEVENINLESGVYIQVISPSSLSINFKPPAPLVHLVTEAGSDVANATITLSLTSDTSRTRTIKINAAGLVDID